MTWAGDRVLDSPGTAANLRFGKDRAPFVAVFTDDGDWGNDEDVIAFSIDTGKAWLIIEAGIAMSVAISTETGDALTWDEAQDAWVDNAGQPVDQTKVTALQETDALTEIQMGLLAQQCISALQATDNPWAELWRLHTAG